MVNTISLVSLDFDTLKESLKTYLREQSQFKDYNFDGSNMNVLLDIMSYYSYLNSVYLNLAVNESFLDSATLQNSVISHAKALNYTPKSYKSSKAQVNLSIVSNSSIISIPALTKFIGTNANGTFNFITNTAITAYPIANTVVVPLDIYQGTQSSDVFIVDNSIEGQRFTLSNPTIDTDSLIITAIENSVNTIFTKAVSILDLTANSSVYYLQATGNSSYEIVFGDNIISKSPINGSVINVAYRITNGTDGDGVSSFNLSDYLGSGSSLSVIAASSGGANGEGIESIRFNAPRSYQTQERAITVDDYRNLVLENYPDIKTCHVYGGEESGAYGVVYISPVTISGAAVSILEKSDISNYLKRRCTVGITPIVVDPMFLYLDVSVSVVVDLNNTVMGINDVKALVSSGISAYNLNSLTDFNTVFRLSRFEAMINGLDKSIVSNRVSVLMKKEVAIELNVGSYITVDYHNGIVGASIGSSNFFSGGKRYRYSDYNPTVDSFKVSPTGVVNESNVLWLVDITNLGYENYSNGGTVDYVNGVINCNKIVVNDFESGMGIGGTGMNEVNGGIEFTAKCLSSDIVGTDNDVIGIDKIGVTVDGG